MFLLHFLFKFLDFFKFVWADFIKSFLYTLQLSNHLIYMCLVMLIHKWYSFYRSWRKVRVIREIWEWFNWACQAWKTGSRHRSWWWNKALHPDFVQENKEQSCYYRRAWCGKNCYCRRVWLLILLCDSISPFSYLPLLSNHALPFPSYCSGYHCCSRNQPRRLIVISRKHNRCVPILWSKKFFFLFVYIINFVTCFLFVIYINLQISSENCQRWCSRTFTE